MATIIWSGRSESDLASIYERIAQDSPVAAAALTRRIVGAAGQLIDFPRSGRVVPEFGRDDLREILVGSYRIVYRLHADEVRVARVYHGARLLREGDVEVQA